ncbi:hypothetical protein ACXU4B_03675 [Dyella soli]|uniref:Uncharacterized protein n=1 Tax=Dyella soli TaxID=522319 RepID=A0A4R0YTD1_9GAMM|nr:hypothetical protein [Dyella soli]TCI10138.1 hypothetical protein EZM97_14560 [Dyella soli]
MTGRAATVVQVDAATVYAEGMLAGLRTACNVLGGKDSADIPPRLHALVREWRAHVYQNEWLAQQGRAADLPNLPDRAQLMARLHAFLMTFPDIDYAD